MSTVLFVAHRADRTGAPIALLHLLRWLRDRTNIPFELLLWEGGELEPELRALCPVEVVRRPIEGRTGVVAKLVNQIRGVAAEHGRRARLLRSYARRPDIGAVYFNSVASAPMVGLASNPARAVICAVHELKDAFARSGLDSVLTLLRRSNHLVAVSEAVAEAIAAADPLLVDRIEVVRGCIPVWDLPKRGDGPVGTREALGIPDDARVALACGAPGSIKGTDLFVELAARTDGDWPRVHFVWLGGSAVNQRRFELDAARRGVGGRVHFVPATDDPAPFFSDADLLVSPSRGDAFPLVVLEAAAHSLPIVCFEGSGGSSEFVSNECGAVVPFLDVDCMAAAIRELAADAALRERLGKAARRRVETHHDVEVGFPRIAEMLGDSLCRRTATSSGESSTRSPSFARVEAAPRPHWSVMIPTRNPTGHLAETLRSVLDQDPGRDAMQITVIDDGSEGDTARRIANELGGDRIEFHRQSEPLGIAGNWNDCVTRSRGRWVHLLHHDDRVLPGFYERLALADTVTPEVGAAFCRHIYLDGAGRTLGEAPLEQDRAGICEGWLDRIATRNRIQCPSIAVRRSTYEALGGFRDDLRFTLDWEMWIRIASRFPVYYEPTLLAGFRVHGASETARLRQDGSNVADLVRAIDIANTYLPPDRRAALRDRALHASVEQALGWARRLLRSGDSEAARAQLREALEIAPWRRVDPRVWLLMARSAGWLERRPIDPGRHA